MASELTERHVAAGDLVIVTSRRVGDSPRIGEILEVIGPDGHERYRVRWDDGHRSLFFPGSDAVVRPAHPSGPDGEAESPTAPRALLESLDEAHVPYALIPHRPTKTAVAEAAELGVAPWQVVKTIVVTTPEGRVRVVLPASERLDLDKVAHVLRCHRVELLSEEALADAYPEFEVGAVPPTHDGHRDRVLVDLRVCGVDTVYCEAGTHDQSLRLGTADLLELSDAAIADLCVT